MLTSMIDIHWIDVKTVQRCTKDLVPDFAEPDVDTASLPSFSHDGVFVHEQLFYRPGTYCVDGVEDTAHSLGSGHAAYYRLPEKYTYFLLLKNIYILHRL